MTTIETIETLQQQSANAWDMAVDTAGPEYPGGSKQRATDMRALADECDEKYEAAIACLEEDDIAGARTHLEQAARLESEGGDASHARSAIKALDANIALELVRSDMGDGGWSLHAHRTDVDESDDPVAAWPMVACGEAAWVETDGDWIGDWSRPNEDDYAVALGAARKLSLRAPLAVSS